MAGRAGSTLATAPAVTCMKILLTVFNFIFLLSGLAILALGVWMKLELYMYMELTTVYWSMAPYVLMGVGAGIALFALLGCCCTVKGKPALLYMYAAFLIVVFVVELSVSVSAFVYKGKFEKGFEQGLEEALSKYKGDEETRKVMDNLQSALHCCGKTSYEDWFHVIWTGDEPQQSVPKSCCKDEKSCENMNISGNNTSIYQNGCHKKVTAFMKTNFGIIGGVAVGFSFLQFFGALFACCLGKNINKAKYEQVA